LVEVQPKPLFDRMAHSQTTFGKDAKWLAITSIQITGHFMNVLIWWRTADRLGIRPHVMNPASAAVILRLG
jgi:hypothetical protein